MSLYHVTDVKRLPYILRHGLQTSSPTISQEYWRRETGDEELVDCSTEAEYYLNLELGRPDCVYFWTDKDTAEANARRHQETFKSRACIIEVDPKKIPCKCSVSDAEIGDEIYDMFYNACMHDISINDEELEKKVSEWEKTVEPYNPKKKYPSTYEVWCPCDIPPNAIKKVELYPEKKLKHMPKPTDQIIVTIE